MGTMSVHLDSRLSIVYRVVAGTSWQWTDLSMVSNRMIFGFLIERCKRTSKTTIKKSRKNK